MRILHFAAGAGTMYCGACARDLALARGLLARGHDFQIIPLYTPLRFDGEAPVEPAPVFLGGINVWLQQQSPLFRKLPPGADRLLDHPGLLRWASRFAISTKPGQLGPMTVSVLAGAEGRQRKELGRLLDYLRTQPRPDVISITNSLLSGLAPVLREYYQGEWEALGRLKLGPSGASGRAPTDGAGHGREGGRMVIVCGLQGEEGFVASLPEQYQREARASMQRNAGSIDLFLAPGAGHAAHMAEYLAVARERIAVVRPPIEHAQYRRGRPRPTDPFVLGYLSVVIPNKGLDVLVKAWVRLVREEGRAIRLRIAGQVLHPGYHAQVRRLVREAGLEGQCEWLGELDLAAKVQFLHDCSVFSVPSRFPESRGIAMMEAMAAEVPVVAPDLGIYPETVALFGGGARLFPAGDAEALAAAVAAVQDDPTGADEQAATAAQGVRTHLDPGPLAEQVEGLLEGLLQRR